MKTLLILRHAKADSVSGLADHERPLKKRGRRDAKQVGQRLRKEGPVPDRIISSTALRARTTAALLAEACGYVSAVELAPDLYGTDSAGVIRVLKEMYHDDDCVMIVGHNPTFEDAVEHFVGRYERLPTCALARIALPIEHWSDLNDATSGRLIDLWRPKDLD